MFIDDKSMICTDIFYIRLQTSEQSAYLQKPTSTIKSQDPVFNLQFPCVHVILSTAAFSPTVLSR